MNPNENTQIAVLQTKMDNLTESQKELVVRSDKKHEEFAGLITDTIESINKHYDTNLGTHLKYIGEKIRSVEETGEKTLVETKAINGKVAAQELKIAEMKTEMRTKTRIGGIALTVIGIVFTSLFMSARYFIKLGIQDVQQESLQAEVYSAVSAAFANRESQIK